MADDASPPADAHPEEEAMSLPKAAAALLHDLPGLLTDRIHLLSLELRRAAGALAQMVVLGLLAAILCATAWIALWVGITTALVEAGLRWPWACALVVILNLAAAAWAGLRVRALAPLLALPATLRRLSDSDAPEREMARELEREQLHQQYQQQHRQREGQPQP
jgi:uncharacterized membrane protein YqjE